MLLDLLRVFLSFFLHPSSHPRDPQGYL